MAGSINLGSIVAYAKLDTSGIRVGIDQTRKGFSQFTADLRKSATQITDLGRTLTAGLSAPLIALGVASVQTAAKMDSLKRGLTAVAGSSQEAERQLERLKEVAKLPGLGFEEAIQGSIRLQAAGLSAQLAERSLKAFGNALATVGGGKAELDGVTLALGQIAAKGKVSAEEINQINERVPQIRAAMKAAFGTADTEALQKMGLTADEFIKKIVTQFEKLPAVTGGAKNAMENFGDASKEFLRALGDTLLPSVTRGLEGLTPILSTMAARFKELPDAAKTAFGGLAVGGAIIGPALLGFGTLVSAIGRVSDALKALAATASFQAFLKFAGVPGAVAAGGLAFAEGIRQTLTPPKVDPKEFAAIAARNRDPAGMSAEIRELEAMQLHPSSLEVSEPGQTTMRNRQRRINELRRQGEAALNPPATPAAPVVMDVNIDRAGRYVLLQNELEAVKAKEAKLEAARLQAKTNAQRNSIGAEILAVRDNQRRIEKALEAYDADAIEKEAKRKAEARKKAQHEENKRGIAEAKAMEAEMDQFVKGDKHQREVLKGAARFSEAFTNAFKLLPTALDTAMQQSMDIALRDTLQFYKALQEEQARTSKAQAESAQWSERFKNAMRLTAAASQAIRDALTDASAAFGRAFKGTKDEEFDANAAADKAIFQENARRQMREQHEKDLHKSVASQFAFMPELARNLADEFYDGFASGLQKIFGKNPFGRALARTLDKFLSALLDDALANVFRKGKGAVAGGGLGQSIVAGDNPIGLPGLGGLGNGGWMAALVGVLGGLFGGGGKKGGPGTGWLQGIFGGASVGSMFGGPIGGAIGGVLGGIGGLLGFDNPVNDRRAVRYGFDFGRHFSAGAAMGLRPPIGAGRAAMRAPAVNIHMGGVTVNHPMDIEALASEMAWRTRAKLRTRVG